MLDNDGSPRTADAKYGVLIGTLCFCGTLVSLQQTIIVPLLPDFPAMLHTTADNAAWLVTATLLAGAVATPVITRLADMFGKRLMMMICLATTVVGSLVGAMSHSLGPALGARALQGIGMALIPVGIAIMRDEVPHDKVPLAVSIMSATLAIGAGAGLPLSGIIAEHMDWHALFWITGTAGVVMLAGVRFLVPESPVRDRSKFDFRGAVLLCTGLTAFLLALSKGGTWGWTDRPTISLAIVAVLLFVAWVPSELRLAHPLVDIRVAMRPVVLLVNISSVLAGFAMFANLLVSTQILQMPKSSGYGLGMGIVDTGLAMAPSALFFGAMAPIAAAVTRRFGAPVSLVSGALVMSGFYGFRVYFSDSLWQIILGSVLVSVGTSFTYAAMPTIIMSAVPVTETASANGLNTLLRSIGTSSSSAAVAAVLTSATAGAFPTYGAFELVFWLAAGAALATAFAASPLLWLVRDTYVDEDLHEVEAPSEPSTSLRTA